MDFPNDIATNVFRIDDIKDIEWAFYKRIDHDGAPTRDQSEDDRGFVDSDQLHIAECMLRECGKHVLLEQDNSGLWVFSLCKAEQEGVLQALRSHGLGCSKAGTLQAGGLNAAFSQNGPVKRSDGMSKTRGLGETNTLAFGANARPISQSMSQNVRNCQDNNSDSRHDLVVAQLYTRIVTAISKSLCRPLVDHKHFLQVGSSTYLEARTLGDRIIEDLRLSWASATTSTLSLDVKWLPTETLLISYSRKPLRRLSQISHLLAHGEKKLSRDTPLLLSPSGIAARFYGIEDVSKKDQLSHSKIDIESMVSSRLAQSGIVIPQDTQWLRVLVEHPPCEDGRQLANHQGHPVMTLWPAHLCFCEDAMAALEAQEIDILTSSRDSGTTDALATVETWYLGKAARTTALETRRQKHELEVQQAEVSNASDDEDALSDPGLEMSHYYTAPQDVSGIYPTPPDGIPTNPIYSSPNNNPLSAGLENEENRGTTPGTICRPFDEQGNEDLFGEMDIDMFATNGLTEADFSFFDEPNDVEMEEEPNRLLAENDLEMKDIPNSIQEVAPARDRTNYSMSENEDGHLRQAMASEGELLLRELDPDPAVRHATSTRETATLDSRPEKTDVTSDKEHEMSDDVDFDTKIVDGAHTIQRTSFDAVRFQGMASAFDGKYGLRGRFGVDIIDPPTTSKPGEQIPNREGLHPRLGIPQATESLSEDDIDVADFTNEELPESPRTTNDHDEAVADSKGNIQQETSRKRKRDASEDLSNMTTPASPASAAAKPVELHERTLAFPALDLFSPRIVDQSRISLMKESKATSPCNSVLVGNDSNFMGIAQMVLDQAVSGSSIFQDSFGRAPDQDFVARQEADNQIEKLVTTLSSTCNKLSKRCTISDYAGLGEKDAASVNGEQIAPLQGQKMPRPHYPTKSPSLGAAQSLFKLQHPYTCVRRTGSSLDIAAASLRFWEELSLAPAHDGKNVTAFCIFPDDENARIHVATFLNMIKGAYQSCNLGSHDLGADLPKYINGQVPLSMDEGAELAPDLNDKCELLGRQLGKLGLRGGNIVIYIVDSSDPERSLPTLCAAFLNLFEAYNTALSETVIDKPNDLVLQIVSSNLLFSPDSVPMPSPTDYRRLAFEVYDRCGPNQEDSHRKHPQYLSVPAIRLAKPIPKSIDLRLTPESYTPRLQFDNCIHIAYVWNPGDHWLTASWTDNQGILSWNACYCFGEEEESPWHSFADIIKEIWDTTLEMMNLGYPRWRLFICKQFPADRRELDAWQKVLGDSSNQQVLVTILTVDTDPPLDFPLQEHTYRHPESSTGLLATPGNTPQSNAASPDISGFGTTPGGAAQVSTPPSSTALTDHDAEARLIDITNETWGVVISSTLQNPPLTDPTISNICPALACTYLMKRAGPRDEDGVLRIAIDIIHGPTGQRAILKEVSTMYSGLALLARVRAMRDGEAAKHVESILPCHLIAARRGHVAVSTTMRYGEG